MLLLHPSALVWEMFAAGELINTERVELYQIVDNLFCVKH
jgi:hypothetical protein